VLTRTVTETRLSRFNRRIAPRQMAANRKSVTVTWLQSTSGAIWNAPLHSVAKLNRRARQGS